MYFAFDQSVKKVSLFPQEGVVIVETGAAGELTTIPLPLPPFPLPLETSLFHWSRKVHLLHWCGGKEHISPFKMSDSATIYDALRKEVMFPMSFYRSMGGICDFVKGGALCNADIKSKKVLLKNTLVTSSYRDVTEAIVNLTFSTFENGPFSSSKEDSLLLNR